MGPQGFSKYLGIQMMRIHDMTCSPDFLVKRAPSLARLFANSLICAALSGCVQAADTFSAGQQGSLLTQRAKATVTAVNLSQNSLQGVPMTFGEPFRRGDIPQGNDIVAFLNGKPLLTQANIKARNPDGSVRHAVLTVLLPELKPGTSETLDLKPVAAVNHGRLPPIKLSDLLQSKFDASINIDIAGVPWHLDARSLLRQAVQAGICTPYGRECNQWLSGPLVSEWVVGGPLLNAQGKPHPRLAVYFAVRAYGPTPVKRVRVDVIVENDWAYAPNPQNAVYTAQILIGGQTVFHIRNLEHYHQARWHKNFWWGSPAPVYAQLSSSYLQASLAVPKYEDIQLSPRVLRSAIQSCEPMQHCDQSKDMSTVGAQPAIGPLTRWSSFYVIDPVYRAYRWMLANDDALGSYDVHYRDQLTGEPLSVIAHPCATLVRPAEVSRCPAPPHADDRFPHCQPACPSPLVSNEPHHPEPAYVAYLVTGDWYYLDELTFWADWIIYQQNPAYRDYSRGLIVHNALRGQAWALRTLGYAAYILPDQDPFKKYFNQVVENNIAWYNAHYTDNPHANALHVITNGYALNYPNHGYPETGIATWQASFFTWSIGNLKDLGFEGAAKLLSWVAKFQINLMTSPDFCWVVASAYELQVKGMTTGPIYPSLKNVYDSTFPKLRGVRCNSAAMARLLSEPRGYHYSTSVMIGYPQSPTGFPANFQIGLAAAADSGVPGARTAWARFESSRIKPNYAESPQFAVVPRH